MKTTQVPAELIPVPWRDSWTAEHHEWLILILLACGVLIVFELIRSECE